MICSQDSPVYEESRFQFSLGNVDITAEIWDGQSSPAQDTYIAMDTETLPISPGKVPALATLQVYYPEIRFVQLIQGGDKAREYLDRLLEINPTSKLVFHNFCFDFEVLGGKKNKLLYQALKRNLIIDTGVRWLLKWGHDGNWVGNNAQWKLDYICDKLLGIELPKDDSIRLTFTPNEKLSYEHIKYACLDPVATMLICQAMPEEYPTEDLQVKASVVLHDMSLRGLQVDSSEFNKLKAKYSDIKENNLKILAAFGVIEGQKGVNARKLELLENIEQRCGLRFPRTEKTNAISASSKVISLFPDKVHPYLTASKLANNAGKFLSSYLNEEFIDENKRVHTRFSLLVKTGRTSSSEPPLQQMPRGGGIREQYRAAPGHCLLTVDYAQQELVCLAQNCLSRGWPSKMAEMINQGKDLHSELGKQIMLRSGGNPNDGVDYRQMAKSVNFGSPGGLGPATFVNYARDSYGVNVTEKEAAELIRVWKETFPEMEHHLKPQPDPHHKGMYIATTITGRKKANTGYCAACNYALTDSACKTG